MRIDRLYEAINEARRFLGKATQCLVKYDTRMTQKGENISCKIMITYESPGLATATKRASLDLTQALVNLRKDDYDE